MANERNIDKLLSEVAQAIAATREGDAARAREISSLESRGELRGAITAGIRGSVAYIPLIDRGVAKDWVELDAQAIGRMRSGQQREAALDVVASNAKASREYATELTERAPSLSVESDNRLRSWAQRELAPIGAASRPNIISEGPERVQQPDLDGVIVRGPSPAIDDLRTEVASAAAARAQGNDAVARELSTIQSRGDLREAARLELPPTSTVDGPVYTKVDTGKELAANWADLDAAEFNRMRSLQRKEVALETISANVRSSPEYAEALAVRSPMIAAAAARENQRLANAQTIGEARMEPVEADAMRSVDRSSETLRAMPRGELEPERARSAVQEDVAALESIKNPDVRRIALQVMGQVAADQPAYRAELQAQAPSVVAEVETATRVREIAPGEPHAAVEARDQEPSKAAMVIDHDTLSLLAERRARDTREVSEQLASDRVAAEANARLAQERADALAMQLWSQAEERVDRRAAIDAEIEAALARKRAEDSRVAAEAMGLVRAPAAARESVDVDDRAPQLGATPPIVPAKPDAARDEMPRDQVKAASEQRSVGEQASKEEDVERRTVLKRPIREDELPDALRKRFVVSAEKTGLLDKGRTEFSFRGGDKDGVVAFYDAGKQLVTARNDQETVRAMIDVIVAKGTKVITLSGDDEFRRRGWIESRLQGLEAHGYEPREADKKRLAELQAERAPTNAITSADREPVRGGPAPRDLLMLDGMEKASREWQFIAPRDEMTRDEAKEWVRDDVAALRAIKGDAERREALDKMAFNTHIQKSYRAELEYRAPEEAKAIVALAAQNRTRGEPAYQSYAETMAQLSPQAKLDQATAQDPERLRLRLIADLRNRAGFDPEEQAKSSEARQDGDRRTQGEVVIDAQRRRERDVQAVMRMNPAELVALAKVVDTPANAASNQQLRQMIDGSGRHEPAYSADPKKQRGAERNVERGRDIDGDSLTPKEKTAMDAMHAVLKAKGYGPEFVAATLTQLEEKIRGQRVHMGELLAHGAAPYKNDKDKEASYYVTLKTQRGTETIWGKHLGEAIAAGQLKVGDQAVLINTGKKKVEVDERAKDGAGRAVVRKKDAILNEWTAQPIDRLAAKDRAELHGRQRRGEPVLQVFDQRAERTRQDARREQEPRDRVQSQTRDSGRQNQDGPER